MSQQQQTQNGGVTGTLNSEFLTGGTSRPDAASALNTLDAAQSNVHIAYGANDLDMPLGGCSVSDVRSGVAEVLNVDPKAVAYVNGQKANDGTVLRPGDRLEFIKETGQKGAK